MAKLSFSQVKVAPTAASTVEALKARVSATDRAKLESLLAEAASQNADKYLSLNEVKAVADAFFESSGSKTSVLGDGALTGALEVASASLKSMASLSNVDGVSAHFSANESLEAKLISELEDAVAKAGGRPTDINMMIFEFQSDEVEKAIVDLARANPNVTFRIIGDSGQSSPTGGNALPSLLAHKLPNVQVKYKKDFPYVWSESQGRPVYNHGASQGLNHHKGFVAVTDGQPQKLVSGSFNWSDTADEKNYEDLLVVKPQDPGTEKALAQYQDEFQGYWNNEAATAGPNAFQNFRAEQMNAMYEKAGRPERRYTALPSDGIAPYQPAPDTRSFDVNGFRLSDRQRLEAILGKTATTALFSERARYGRFASLEELYERQPALKSLSAEKKRALEQNASFGAMTVSINAGSVEELDQAGFSLEIAKAIVAHREAKGDFEAVTDLLSVPGMSQARLNLAARHLNAREVDGFFNSRPFGAVAGGTGYGSAGARVGPVRGEGEAVQQAKASVTVAATELFDRAKPGQAISVAMYGMSVSAPEVKSLIRAAERGAIVKVVLNDSGTAAAAAALKALAAKGLEVEVRIQTARTMHEKFGVVGDDVFVGSANFSESSSTKHSEDRFSVKNAPEISAAFQSQFELLWARSKVA